MAAKKKTERKYLVKLVRDHVNEHIGGDGVSTYEILPKEAYIPLLRRKLIEESAEYLEASDVNELADVLTIIRGLAKNTVAGGMKMVVTTLMRKEARSGVQI